MNDLLRHQLRLRAVEFAVAGSHPIASWSGDRIRTRSPRLAIRRLQRQPHKDSQTSKVGADSDLQRVVKAWHVLPTNLKAAILAIVLLKYQSRK